VALLLVTLLVLFALFVSLSFGPHAAVAETSTPASRYLRMNSPKLMIAGRF